MATPDLLGMVVTDMAATLRFYRLLGLEIPPQADGEQHVEATAPGGFRIAWDTLALMRQIDPDFPPPSGHRMSLAFKCATPAEVDALYAAVLAAGYRGHKPPWDAFWGQRYATLLDPDGAPVDLFAAL